VKKQGIFITLEGGDGAGKSTQAKLLETWIALTAHREVVRTFEPGDTPVGQRIRKLVLHGENLDARAEALLFAADRAQHAATVLRPALERGAVVICDRYIDSSVAYQGEGRELCAEDVRKLSAWATRDLQPDLTVVLDIDPRVALQRGGEDPDRMERESLQFHDAVRESFLTQARLDPQRYFVTDAQAEIDEIQNAIRLRVGQLLGEDS